jgi:hypothetical protein
MIPMTVAAFPPYTYYWGDGVTTAFAYPFEVERPEDFVAYQDHVQVSNYTLTGLGEEYGGQVTFSTPPALGVSLLLLRQVPLDQETMYPAYSAFPAAAHEKTLDRLCMQVWQLQEQLERTTRFRQTIRPPWRNLEFPEPQPNTVLGWDSAGQQWTLYPSGVTQIPVDPVSGIGWGKNTIALTPTAGSAQATGLLFPSGVLALAVSAWVETTLGPSQGLQQVGLGTPDQPDCWGRLPGLTADTVTSAGLFHAYGGQPQAQSGMVCLTAYGGLFDGTGTVYVTGHFQTFGAAKTLGYSYTSGAAEESVPVPPAFPPGAPLAVVRYDASGNGLEATPLLATDSAGQLAVGTTTPTATLTVEGSTRLARSGTNVSLTLESYVSTAAQISLLTTNRSYGTTTAREAIPAGVNIGGWNHQGYDGTAHRLGAQILSTSEEAFTATSRGTRLTLSTATQGTTTLVERARIDSQGRIGLHTTLSATLGSGASYMPLTVKGSQLFVGQSSTQERPQALIVSTWSVSTDATRQGRLSLNVYDSVAARELIRMEADGSTAKLSFFAAAAVAKPAVTGSRGGNVALASALTALASLGLLTDSSSA